MMAFYAIFSRAVSRGKRAVFVFSASQRGPGYERFPSGIHKAIIVRCPSHCEGFSMANYMEKNVCAGVIEWFLRESPAPAFDDCKQPEM